MCFKKPGSAQCLPSTFTEYAEHTEQLNVLFKKMFHPSVKL